MFAFPCDISVHRRPLVKGYRGGWKTGVCPDNRWLLFFFFSFFVKIFRNCLQALIGDLN